VAGRLFNQLVPVTSRYATLVTTDRDVAAATARALEQYMLRPPEWRPLPHQVPPPGDWYGWLLLAGRGSGKTDTCSNYVERHVKGPPCLGGSVPHWIGVIAPTLGDAVTACYSGPSGIRAHSTDAKLVQTTGGTIVRWSNGSQAKMFGAQSPEDVERLRAGGNTCLVWAEELAAWRYLDACWAQMRFGLRSGKRPHWIASTTPKPRPLIKKLAKTTPHNVVVTRASTDDNPHLEQHVRAELYDEYGGLQLGRQELHAEILDEDKNALWRRKALDQFRVREAPELRKVSVGVDPSGGAGEQGIVVVGKSLTDVIEDGKIKTRIHGYVLDDRTVTESPAGWGRAAVRAAVDWEADDIVVEVNFGGDMAVSTIAGAAEAMGINIPVRSTRASRGKRVRAEPVAALSERGYWHHVGTFEPLEDQLVTWTEELGFSPDRLDAMVWPAWHQRMVSARLRGEAKFGGSEAVLRIVR
jgi:phage terminase large subunit-like protein